MDFERLEGNEIFVGKLYEIPEYQRYYEWEVGKKYIGQVDQFWEDIKGYFDSSNPFPLGVFILQKNGRVYEIVDGQQRLTTLVILLRSLIETLKERVEKDNATTWEKLLIDPYSGKPVLKVQEQDKLFFENCIIRGEDCSNPKTNSQRRIKEAKEFFDKKLKKLTDEELKKLENLLNNRIFVFVIKVSDKKEASYMFELHNARGKPLSNLDKLKSYILHTLYIKNAPSGEIDYVYNTFGEIYRIVYEIDNQLKRDGFSSENLDEDNILTAFGNILFNYDYRGIEHLKSKRIKEASLKDIKEFVLELYRAFQAVESFVKDSSTYACYVKDFIPLKFNFVLPLLIKVYSLKLPNREEFLKVLDRLLFIHNLAFTNAWIEKRLRNTLINFNKNTTPEKFEENIFSSLENESFWSYDRLLTNLKGHMYNNLSRVILKRYEIHLNRSLNYDGILQCENVQKDPWQLEHIAPRSLEWEKIPGYERSEEFLKGCLHSLGNLLLISQRHNIVVGNKPFEEKLKSYKNSPLKHHREVEKFSKNGIWNCDSIKQRLEFIVNFARNEWRF
jgi:uncharacterized protein with ParB-like and HNH nuclease domain